jgi:N-acetyl-anhydromuramyl-L-alanine amidase AmpD
VNWIKKCLLFIPFFKASKVGPPPTSPSSSPSSTEKSTTAPNTTARAAASKQRSPSAKPFPEKQLNSPNVTKGRRIKPQAIVLHHTCGSYAGSVAWCADPASRVSYHAIVAKDGRRTVLADPDERAWHAGKSSWRGRRDLNSWSVGAAFEGDTNTRQLGENEMASMTDYLLPIMRQYGLSLSDVTDHRTVSPGRKDDLNPTEFARFKAYLAARLA